MFGKMIDDKIVLVISSREGGDWSIDLVFAGLVKLLGPSKVLCYPPRKKYTADIVSFGRTVRTGDKEADYGIERKSLGYTAENVMINQLDEFQLRMMIAKGDIGLIVVDERDECFELYCRLRAPAFDVPVICVSGHDRFWNQSPEHVRSLYGKNFKLLFSDLFEDRFRELPYFRPYNWSTNFDHLGPGRVQMDRLRAAKQVDVCFYGYNSHPDRERFVDHVLKRWSHLNLDVMLEKRPNVMDSFMYKWDYFESMARAKICLNLRGAAVTGKTLRFWEIPYVGSFMLSQRYKSWPREILAEQFECSYFSDEKELDDKIQFYLENDELREKIAEQGLEASRSNSCKERVRQILTATEEVPRG